MAINNGKILNKESLAYLCGLIRDLSSVSEGIDDINLRSDGTFSSVKIDTLLKALKSDCNEYTDRLVANLSRLELKIVTDEADITQPNVLYLHKPDEATSYNQYVVIEGNKVLLGTTDISMTDYYTITQADAKFCLLTDYNSLKTAYEAHKNDTDIHVTTSDKEKWDGYNDTINEMKTNFQGGVNTIYDSVVEKGVTPVDKSPSEIADAISKLGGDLTSIYNALTNKGLPMAGAESEDQISAIITDLLTIKSFTTRADSTTFVFNGTKDTIKDTELLDTSSGLILEFSSKELTSVESSGYIEFTEIDKSEYNNKIKFI